MLLILIGGLLWIPAVWGWGGLWPSLARRLGPASTASPAGDLLAALFGLALLTTLATLINFVLPITPLVSGLALLAGWALLAARLRGFQRPAGWPWLAALGVVWLAAIALFASGPVRGIFDTGLYHLQAIRWTEVSRLPLGAGNLLNRLAFNDSWFQLAALLDLPLWLGRGGGSVFLPSGLLTWFLLMAASRAGLQLARGGEWSRGALFLAAAALVPWTAGNPLYLTSAAPDWPVVVLSLAAVAAVIEGLENRLSPTQALAALLFLASYGVTVKLSAGVLILLAAPVMVYAGWQGQPVRWRPLAVCAAAFGLAFGAPWMARTLLLSGCAVYPVAATCLPSLAWHMPAADVRVEMRWVMAWARWPNHNPDEVLAGWSWLRPWANRLGRLPELRRTAQVLAVGLAALWLPLGAPGQQRARRAWAWLCLPLAGGLAYWFATAPDFRFGAGLFWALGLWALAAGLQRLHAAGRQARWARAGLWLALGIVIALAGRTALNLGPRLKETLAQPALAQWPAVPEAPVVAQQTMDGYAINVPAEGQQCWLAPPPCTPFLDGDLRVERDASGWPRMFYLP